MPWYIYSIIAMFALAGYTLSQKWASNRGISAEKFLLYVFGISLIGYFIVVGNQFSGLFARNDWWILVVAGLFMALFSYIGDVSEMEAVRLSPNSAYPNSIRSLGFIVLFLVTWFFGGKNPNIATTLGILAVFLGLLPLVLGDGENKKSIVVRAGFWKNWQWPSFVAMISFSIMTIIANYNQVIFHFTPEQTILILVLFVTPSFLIANLRKIKSESLGLSRNLVWPVILAAMFSFLLNWMSFTALPKTNAGYAQATLELSTLFVLVLSPLIFPKEKGGDIDVKKWIGSIVMLLGIITIIIFSS